MSIYHDEIEIEDMEYDEETETYHYPCPCGDRFEITLVRKSENWNKESKPEQVILQVLMPINEMKQM